MASLLAKLRHKSHEFLNEDEDHTNPPPSSQQPQALVEYSNKLPTDYADFQPPPGPPPSYRAAIAEGPEPATATPVVNVQHPPHSHPAPFSTSHADRANRQLGSNMGMAAGALVGSQSGGDPVMGMVEGQVGHIMIAQQINQHQKHQYWREQAMDYRTDGSGGLAPASVGGDRPRSRSERRHEKRRERWDRRAGRRDGVGSDVG